MDIGAAFVAKGEAPEGLRPRQAPLDDPPSRAEATATGALRSSQDGRCARRLEVGVLRRLPIGAVARRDAPGTRGRRAAPRRGAQVWR